MGPHHHHIGKMQRNLEKKIIIAIIFYSHYYFFAPGLQLVASGYFKQHFCNRKQARAFFKIFYYYYYSYYYYSFILSCTVHRCWVDGRPPNRPPAQRVT